MPVFLGIMAVRMACGCNRHADAHVRERVVHRCDRVDAPSERAQIQPAEQNQHQRHAKLKPHPEPLRNDESEKNNRATDNEQRKAVTDSPENSGNRRAADVALPADDTS